MFANLGKNLNYSLKSISIILLICSLLIITVFASPVEPSAKSESDSLIKENYDPDPDVELMKWFFGKNSDDSSNSSKPQTQTIPLGPLHLSNIHNSSLKRLQISPESDKFLRDGIYKFNSDVNFRKRLGELTGRFEKKLKSHETHAHHNANKRRSIRSFKARKHGDDDERDEGDFSFSKRQLGDSSPQEQYYYMQQQAQAAAMLQQQQQLLALQSGGNYGGGLGGNYRRRRRPGYLYGNYDDDDSESDEYDDFDSDEFMKYPLRAGYIPPTLPGFRG